LSRIMISPGPTVARTPDAYRLADRCLQPSFSAVTSDPAAVACCRPHPSASGRYWPECRSPHNSSILRNPHE